jgi:hypothetical protein
MKKPVAISIGLFLFLFGLAFAKATQGKGHIEMQRKPAGILKAE